VTFSGDTTKSDNLINLAKDTDILVHEAQFSLDDAYYHDRFPPNYLVNSHTSAEPLLPHGSAGLAMARRRQRGVYRPLKRSLTASGVNP
jgi:hypothetical protein